jgi:hypothetical protein
MRRPSKPWGCRSKTPTLDGARQAVARGSLPLRAKSDSRNASGDSCDADPDRLLQHGAVTNLYRMRRSVTLRA